MFACVYYKHHVPAVHDAARRGRQIPRHWSYRGLSAATCVPCLPLLSHLSSPSKVILTQYLPESSSLGGVGGRYLSSLDNFSIFRRFGKFQKQKKNLNAVYTSTLPFQFLGPKLLSGYNFCIYFFFHFQIALIF